MTLLPPFTVDESLLYEIEELIAEEIEVQFDGIEQELSIPFKGIDIFSSSKKKSLIYAKPVIPANLFHCQEAIVELLKNYEVKFKKSNGRQYNDCLNLDSFLPLASVENDWNTAAAVETAQLEFSEPFSLHGKSISIFKKFPHQWALKRNLHHLENKGGVPIEESFIAPYSRGDKIL